MINPIIFLLAHLIRRQHHGAKKSEIRGWHLDNYQVQEVYSVNCDSVD